MNFFEAPCSTPPDFCRKSRFAGPVQRCPLGQRCVPRPSPASTDPKAVLHRMPASGSSSADSSKMLRYWARCWGPRPRVAHVPERKPAWAVSEPASRCCIRPPWQLLTFSAPLLILPPRGPQHGGWGQLDWPARILQLTATDSHAECPVGTRDSRRPGRSPTSGHWSHQRLRRGYRQNRAYRSMCVCHHMLRSSPDLG